MKGRHVDYHAPENDTDYRKSGLTLALMLAALYGLLLLKGAQHPSLLGAALLLAVLSWFRLQPVRLIVGLFTACGNVMQRFTNPLVFACIYLVALVPVALVLKLTGKDLLLLRFDAKLSSYWMKRPASDWKKSFIHPF
jgi:hypothetical protein